MISTDESLISACKTKKKFLLAELLRAFSELTKVFSLNFSEFIFNKRKCTKKLCVFVARQCVSTDIFFDLCNIASRSQICSHSIKKFLFHTRNSFFLCCMCYPKTVMFFFYIKQKYFYTYHIQIRSCWEVRHHKERFDFLVQIDCVRVQHCILVGSYYQSRRPIRPDSDCHLDCSSHPDFDPTGLDLPDSSHHRLKINNFSLIFIEFLLNFRLKLP